VADEETFADRLKTAMRRNHIGGPAALAEKLGVSPTTAGPWYNGLRLPDLAGLVLLAEKLEVSLDWLLRGVGPIDPPDLGAYERGVKEGTEPYLRALAEIGEVRRRAGMEPLPPGIIPTMEEPGDSGDSAELG